MFGQIQTQYGFIVEKLNDISKEQNEIKKQLADGNVEFVKIKETLRTHEIDISVLKAAIESARENQIELALGSITWYLIKENGGKIATVIGSVLVSAAAIAWGIFHKGV